MKASHRRELLLKEDAISTLETKVSLVEGLEAEIGNILKEKEELLLVLDTLRKEKVLYLKKASGSGDALSQIETRFKATQAELVASKDAVEEGRRQHEADCEAYVTERSRLENQIQDLELNLDLERSRLENQIQDLKGMKDEADARILNLEKEVEVSLIERKKSLKLQEQVSERLREELESLKKKNSEKESNLKLSVKRKMEVEERYAKIEIELARQNEISLKVIEDLREEVERAQDSLAESIKAQAEEAEALRMDHESLIYSLRESLSQDQSLLRVLTREKDALKDMMSRKEAQFKAGLERYERTVTELREAKEKLEAEESKRKSEQSQCEERLKEEEAKGSERAHELLMRNKDVTRLEAELSISKTTILEKSKEIELFFERQSMMDVENKDLRVQIACLVNEKESLNDKLKTKMHKLSVLEETASKSKTSSEIELNRVQEMVLKLKDAEESNALFSMKVPNQSPVTLSPCHPVTRNP